MLRYLTIAACLLFMGAGSLRAQTADIAMAGVQICDCLPADNYLLVKKKKTLDGVSSTVFHANVEVLITFLTAYGHVGAHALNLNWPSDLIVGSADLTAMLTGFNHYPPFEETLCSWEVVNVASHGWILEQIDAAGYSEAYIHESTFDEFLEGPQTYGQCGLNSFDLEMVYLPDSVIRLTFVRKFLGNGASD